MEVKRTNRSILPLVRICLCCCLCLLVASTRLHAQQPIKQYKVRDGKMYIELGKGIYPASLDSFIQQYKLQDLGLRGLVEKGLADSLKKHGWKVEKNNNELCIITKPFSAFGSFNNPADKIVFAGKNTGSYSALFPAVSSSVVFGINKFRNKYPFEVNDSVVTFFLKNNTRARQVMLAGSFNNWMPDVLSMIKTDSGWIAYVKLSPGKYWYKFVIDGNWNIDYDNQQNENDNRGNVNSVYYKTNTLFSLTGYIKARKVFVSGSFNNWQTKQLQMVPTSTGWILPIYLANGTHTYRFNADGNWFTDPNNNNRLPNEFNDFNSVVRIGKTHLFRLNGHTTASQVVLTGSFNGWRKYELVMNRTSTGWELPYVLGPGNYEYRFIVDGKEMEDPNNPLVVIGTDGKKNGYLVVEPNYTFHLKGYGNARSVYLAGDFNNWSPQGLPMKREGNDWAFSVNLSLGKHLYKFVVDGEWIKDPYNKLWEQNEFNTGNSIVWIEQ